MSCLTGKVALVTGSSRGIGAAIAALFAQHGAKVAVNGRDGGAVAAAAARITRDGGTAMPVTADVTDLAAIESMRGEIEAGLGPVSVLVANAGGNPTRPAPLETISEQDWHAAVDANLTAAFLTIKSFLPGMKERHGGSIVTISSAAARRGHAASPVPYAAAKAGVQILTQHAAAQAGPFGVRVNCVAPETILTERNQQQIPADVQASLVQAHPLRRLGTPQDVARAVLYLASEDAAWTTGTVLDVAGGAVMASP